jgi:DNA-binding CsgD family transcriptional regulator
MVFDVVSKEVETVLGYAPSEFKLPFINELIHPDDLPWFLTFGKKILEFFTQLPASKLMKYKVRYDLRYRKKNGEYIRILYQGIMLEHDESGGILRTFNMHTDINYLKKEGKPILSLIGMDGEPSFPDMGSKNLFIKSSAGLTKRENQILTLLIQGKLSKEIAGILSITKQTVDTHRKNMLRKNKLSNTGELIGKAIGNGWV